jgi:pyruvate formate lyase activating enzyme
MSEIKTHPAVLWEKEGEHIRCRLCPWNCLISEGKTGICRVRQNIGGKLVSLNYHRVCAASVDPIEKKPLFHFLPGSLSFSVACVGCNFQCEFCQNWQISQQPRLETILRGQTILPELIVREASSSGCQSISYTYTEPTIYFELAYETAKLAYEKGIKNVFVSNGFISIEALKMIEPFLDGINVDLKSFREDFYRTRCKGKLSPVLDALRWLAKSDIWVEVTTLVIPGENDSAEELNFIASFIANEMGTEVPWHVSRFHPDYDMTNIPATPMNSIERAIEAGQKAGLKYIYAGNISSHATEHTYCPGCKKILIERRGFSVLRNHLILGRCSECNTTVEGVF